MARPFYHGTGLDLLFTLAKQGLQPQHTHGSPERELYVTPHQPTAMYYAGTGLGETGLDKESDRLHKVLNRQAHRRGVAIPNRIRLGHRSGDLILAIHPKDVATRLSGDVYRDIARGFADEMKLADQGITPRMLDVAFSPGHPHRSLSTDVKVRRAVGKYLAEAGKASPLYDMEEVVLRKPIPPSKLRVSAVRPVGKPDPIKGVRNLPLRKAIAHLQKLGIPILPVLALLAGAGYLAKRAGGTHDGREGY